MRDTHLTRILCQRGMKLVEFARLVGVDKATVSRWSASRVPAERLPDIEARTGIKRGELRPDLYEGDTSPSPAASGGNAESPSTTGARP
ncbi:MAG: hypothetical protein DI527_00920 [Chelatococcus sp.]|nr:MAG: hypothetical protein DI527_00920 [Chelatococcus sp.]